MMSTTEPLRHEIFGDPIIDLTYGIDINSDPSNVWPWIVQVGYHRAGWYIDKWWDRFEQDFFWPLLVPAKDRGTWQPPAQCILPEYQGLKRGDIIPDGPPGSAYYEVIALEPERLLVLRATTHLKYVAPRFIKLRGEFRWAFSLEQMSATQTRLTSRWRGWGEPRLYMALLVKPGIWLIDHIQQPEILKGIKRRAERVDLPRDVATHQRPR
jgi:hypothetical protein